MHCLNSDYIHLRKQLDIPIRDMWFWKFLRRRKALHSVLHVIWCPFSNKWQRNQWNIFLPASLVSVTECDNKEKLGSIVNVDFMAINQPCNCEVKPQFSGDLVFASNVVLYDCFTEITIRKNAQNDDIFAVRCPRTHSSKMYSVSNSSVFEISSTYLRRTGDTSFHQSIQIFQGNYSYRK